MFLYLVRQCSSNTTKEKVPPKIQKIRDIDSHSQYSLEKMEK